MTKVPGTADCAGDHCIIGVIFINSITLSGLVVSILEHKTDDIHAANCLLKEYNGGKPVTYHVSFWDDDAEYFMNHVEKNDSIEVSGFVFQIKDIGKGPFIEIRGCKLHSINNIKLIAVEDIPSLLQRGAERHGRKA